MKQLVPLHYTLNNKIKVMNSFLSSVSFTFHDGGLRGMENSLGKETSFSLIIIIFYYQFRL